MRRVIILLIMLVALAAASALFWPGSTQTLLAEEEESAGKVLFPIVQFTCWPDDTPAGALPHQPPPLTCGDRKLRSGPGTSTQGPNSWHDDFNHGLSLNGFAGTNYVVFERIGAFRTVHWRHANHWMVDLTPHPEENGIGWDNGVAMMRPNRSFTFENGTLIVETDVAASMKAYGTQAWPEIVVSAGPQPSVRQRGGSYGYDLFPKHWTLGCRLQSNRRPICTLRANDGRNGEVSTRLWEISWFQKAGTHVYGGNEEDGRGRYWRVCRTNEPDINCRDRFRLELTRTSLTLYVNGIKYFQQSGLPPLPNSLVNGNVYVYLVSTQVLHPANTIRYHWDHFTVNTDQPPSAAPNFEPPSP